MARLLGWLVAFETHVILVGSIVLAAPRLRTAPMADEVAVEPSNASPAERALRWLGERPPDSIRASALTCLAFASVADGDGLDVAGPLGNAVIPLLATDAPDPIRTLALVLAANHPRLPVMASVAQRAVDGLADAQRADGSLGDDETTAWALVALADALVAGFDVRASALRRALAHVDARSRLIDRPGDLLVAAAAFVRILDRQRVKPPRETRDPAARYVTARSLALVDEKAAAKMRTEIAAAQRDDGSWDGDVRATALAVMTLAIR